MKYIKKFSKNEPVTLKKYKKTPNATYSGFGDTDNLLKNALLKEQGGICAYCMRRISLNLNVHHKPMIEVEHILPQATGKNDLEYFNMLGVCNGNLGGKEHCDKSKKKMFLNKLSPLNKKCEQMIHYSLSGEVKSVADNNEIETDINNILNLNNQSLIDLRRNALDNAIEFLKKEHPSKKWSRKNFEKLIEIYEDKGKNGNFKPFCNYVIYCLRLIMSKPKYMNGST